MNSHSNTPNLRLTDPYQTGEAVQSLQQQLAQLNLPITIDGIFGPGTDQAVKTFQTQQGLTPDGIVGPATRAQLQALLQPEPEPEPAPQPVAAARFTTPPSPSTPPSEADSSPFQRPAPRPQIRHRQP